MKSATSTLILFLILNCGSHTEDQQADLQALHDQLEAIHTFIAQHRCDENTSCESIAAGKKACGGPSLYLIYPTSVDRNDLEEMVAEYTTAQAAYNRKYNISSDCSLVSPPQEITCTEGQCQIP